MNKKLAELYSRRVALFQQRIEKRILKDSIHFEAEYALSESPVAFTDRLRQNYRKIGEGEMWGQAWQSAWFHLKSTIPAQWAGEHVVAQLEFTGEGLVFTADGQPVQSVSGGAVFEPDYHREIVRLFSPCQGGEEVELWVETAANSLFGVVQEVDPPRASPTRFGHFEAKVNKMRLCLFDQALWHLWLDVDVLFGIWRSQPETSVRRARLLHHLNEMIDLFADCTDNAQRCREYLKAQLFLPASASELSVTAVGHAHIDTAWLWPVRETVRKCARTFANQLTLLRKYPQYVFGASQAQHYAFVKEKYPALYSEIKRQIKTGRWEVQGGMWVEADCNLISGESMIRQILHGKNFFRDEFGIDVNNLWLPDVFGYSAVMPQILRKSGIDFFLTQKISWSQFNKFPHHTFKWRGIDGSEVLTHFPPEDTYNSNLHSHSLAKARDNFSEKAVLDEFICLFGVGDGGGGPTENQIERGVRMANLDGCPRLSFDRADNFFERLRKCEDDLQTWVGELYLELHRGTLTTQALVKKCNRQLEMQLRQLEILWSCLPLNRYPAKELDEIWKKVLLNQFHDILPGSSINEVYRFTHAEYDNLLQRCQALQSKAADDLFDKEEDTIVLFNSLSFPYHGTIELPEEWRGFTAQNADSQQELPQQVEAGGQKSIVSVSVPPLSFLSIRKGKQHQQKRPRAVSELILENDLMRYEFAADGTLIRAFDKEVQREIVPINEKGNVLTLYEDRPNDWDAWDVDIFYETAVVEHAELFEIVHLADGPVRRGLQHRFRIGESQIEQTIYLEAHTKRLDFHNSVDWRESHRMLRVAFPVDIATDKARFDIQYGFVERPTHRNTSWDWAKFEVAGHRYVDLSEQDYGVALLNDCKYGHKVYDHTLDLNLLRSPRHPDPDADQGQHEFTYCLLPHTGDLVHSNVIAEAAQLNQGIAVFSGYTNKKMTATPCFLVGEGLSLEVLKRAEKSNDYIIRIVEIYGKHSSGELIVNVPYACLCETDLMEWRKSATIYAKQSHQLMLQPFEIKTYLMECREGE